MEIKFDIPFEVSEKQYFFLIKSGVCAGRIHDGKYYLKLWIMSEKKKFIRYLKNS